MKKIVLLSFVLLIIGVLKAQNEYYFRDGKFILGGRINYIGGGRVVTNDHKIQNKGYTLKVAPSFGYYINNLMSVGSSVGYEHVKDGRGKQNTYSVTPYFRYYFPVKQSFLFLQAESGIGFGRNRLNGGERNSYLIWDSGLKPGFFFNLSERVGAEITFSRVEYRKIWIKDKHSQLKSSGSELKYQILDISFGFSYLF